MDRAVAAVGGEFALVETDIIDQAFQIVAATGGHGDSRNISFALIAWKSSQLLIYLVVFAGVDSGDGDLPAPFAGLDDQWNFVGDREIRQFESAVDTGDILNDGITGDQVVTGRAASPLGKGGEGFVGYINRDIGKGICAGWDPYRAAEGRDLSLWTCELVAFEALTLFEDRNAGPVFTGAPTADAAVFINATGIVTTAAVADVVVSAIDGVAGLFEASAVATIFAILAVQEGLTYLVTFTEITGLSGTTNDVGAGIVLGMIIGGIRVVFVGVIAVDVVIVDVVVRGTGVVSGGIFARVLGSSREFVGTTGGDKQERNQ